MRSLIALCLFIVLGAAQAQAPAKITTRQYIETYKDIAIREMLAYGIPASITLAQGILESGSGNSPLSRHANNHFGIKCKNDWKGETYNHDDDEKNECFRKYPSPLDSYEDHSRFLKERQRYAFLFELPKDDYKGWAHGLKKAGYATNPQYAQLLIKTIEDHKLYEFDQAKMSEVNIALPKDTPAIPKVSSQVDGASVVVGQKRIVGENNGVPYVLWKKGDSVESLAKELDIFTWQLYKYNDLPKGKTPKEGDKIYTKPKKNKAAVKEYTPEMGETYTDIAQKFAIKRKSLLRRNQLPEHPQDLAEPLRPLKLR